MALTRNELNEWKSLQYKSKKYRIPIRRKGANVIFGEGLYAQLGTNRGTEIMNARIKVNKRLQLDGMRREY